MWEAFAERPSGPEEVDDEPHRAPGSLGVGSGGEPRPTPGVPSGRLADRNIVEEVERRCRTAWHEDVAHPDLERFRGRRLGRQAERRRGMVCAEPGMEVRVFEHSQLDQIDLPRVSPSWCVSAA